MPNSQVMGKHLLGYCYLNLGETEKAFAEFKKCVEEGVQEDWQLLVELILSN